VLALKVQISVDAVRFVASLALGSLGATSITGFFYGLYVHLPSYISTLWRALLGASFALAAFGLIAGWLCFVGLDIAMQSGKLNRNHFE